MTGVRKLGVTRVTAPNGSGTPRSLAPHADDTGDYGAIFSPARRAAQNARRATASPTDLQALLAEVNGSGVDSDAASALDTSADIGRRGKVCDK